MTRSGEVLRRLRGRLWSEGPEGPRSEGGRGGGQWRARTPDEFDEFVLEVPAGGNNEIQVVGPDNENSFIALRICECQVALRGKWKGRVTVEK